MGQIITTQNLVATKVVRLAGQSVESVNEKTAQNISSKTLAWFLLPKYISDLPMDAIGPNGTNPGNMIT